MVVLKRAADTMMIPDEYDKYELMRQRGVEPRDAYREALASGLGKIRAIRMLRAVFSMSLEDAAELAEEAK